MIPTGIKARHIEPLITGVHGTRISDGKKAYWKPYHVCGIRETRDQGARQWLDPLGPKASYKDSWTSSRLQKIYCDPVNCSFTTISGASVFSCTGDLWSLTGGPIDPIQSVMGGKVVVGELFQPGAAGYDTNALDRSVLKAYSKLNSSTVSSLVTGGESKETLKMLRLKKAFDLLKSPLKTSLNLAIDFKKEVRRFKNSSKLGKTMTLPQAAANVWLEARYGWRPLMGEIASYRDFILNGVTTHEKKIWRVSAAQRLEYTPTTVVYPRWQNTRIPGLSGYFYSGGELTFVWTRKDKYTTHIFYRTKSMSDISTYARELGLTIYDVPSLIWELTPLSFVADWFVDTGLWLNAWKPRKDITVLKAISTFKEERRVGKILVRDDDRTSNLKLLNKPLIGFDFLSRATAPPKPVIPTYNPTLLSLAKKADSASLIFQRISGILKPLSKR